ncbi:hypothetical protein D1872_321780 [compost metagenome]
MLIKWLYTSALVHGMAMMGAISLICSLALSSTLSLHTIRSGFIARKSSRLIFHGSEACSGRFRLWVTRGM